MCFLSYPGGGNGKQRDIAHFSRRNEITTIKKTMFLDYFSRIAEFQSGNRPVIKSPSMHHDPTLTSSFSTLPSISACTDPYTLITLLLAQALHPSDQVQETEQTDSNFNSINSSIYKHKKCCTTQKPPNSTPIAG